MLSRFEEIHLLCIFSILFLDSIAIFGQIDSTYIQPFDRDFSARIYINEKSAGFYQTNDNKETEYKTNAPGSIGLGASWKHLSFSFSKGFDAFRDKDKGKTKSIEFQHHSYGHKIIYDIFLQQHKGFYRDEQNTDKTYDLYPDMELNMYGGSIQYIFNNKKFSSRAAFNLNERQIKSAGSVLFGGSIYYSKIQADSVVIFEGMDRKQRNLQLGLSLGYAYSWAITQRWTATPSFTLGVMMGNNDPRHFFNNSMKIYPALNARFGLSYNAKTWSIGSVFLINRVYLFYKDKQSLSMQNEQIQLTFVKRFNWHNKHANKVLHKINGTKEKLRL